MKSFFPKWRVFSTALKLGLSSFITQMTIVVISLVCNIMLAKYGALSEFGIDIPIAIIGIESKVFTVVINLVVGLFGQPTNIPNPEDYWKFAEMTFRIFLSLVTFTCLIKMSSIFFQAVGKSVHAVISSLTRDIICFVPLVIVLPQFFGIKGILYAAPVADLIAVLVAAAMTIHFMKSLQKQKMFNGKGSDCGQN